MNSISISVVSTSQLSLIVQLLNDIQKHCDHTDLELILTLNDFEEFNIDTNMYSFPIVLIRNNKRLGFAKNHNQAFRIANGSFFCVINPDIRFDVDPFVKLINNLGDPSLGIVAPQVLNTVGDVEDSARRFPSPVTLFLRFLQIGRGIEYPTTSEIFYPDWIGGMFMVFPRAVYMSLGGFNEKFQLYCEDLDICARSFLNGYKIAVNPQVNVIHDARRQSHRNLRYFRWHIVSTLKYFLSSTYWELIRNHK